ncbi:MAG: OmpH family outer membrane protein [Roseinatronobacter sp.]|nr:OmpH family outer membrane protein [Roseinatronobacter sp.]
MSLGESAARPVQPGLRILDEEQAFRQSLFGLRVAQEVEAASRALEAENERLLGELTAREAELTILRAEMSVEEFRAAATAFDLQAEATRQSQSEKRQRLVQFEDAERRRFFANIGPVLQDLLDRLGGQVLIDARAVIIGPSGLDMTEEAVAAIDAVLGDGGPPPFPLNLP